MPLERRREVYGELRALSGQIGDEVLHARIDAVCADLTGGIPSPVRRAPRELDAGSRLQAVSNARRLGLLP